MGAPPMSHFPIALTKYILQYVVDLHSNETTQDKVTVNRRDRQNSYMSRS